MKTFNLSFEITKPIEDKGKYMVTCDEMDYSGWTSDPKLLTQELLNEWFDMDMGQETPPPNEY